MIFLGFDPTAQLFFWLPVIVMIPAAVGIWSLVRLRRGERIERQRFLLLMSAVVLVYFLFFAVYVVGAYLAA